MGVVGLDREGSDGGHVGVGRRAASGHNDRKLETKQKFTR